MIRWAAYNERFGAIVGVTSYNILSGTDRL